MAELSGTRRRFKGRYFVLVFILTMCSGLFFLFKGCNHDISPITANIVLEKGGKKYLFSDQPTDVVQKSITNGELPAVYDILKIYKDGEDYYLSPSSIQTLASIAGGEYTLHPQEAGSTNGFVTADLKNSFSMKTSYKSTSELGRQDIVNTVVLTNSRGKQLKISWTQHAKKYEFYGMKNCELHTFWTETSPAPGNVVISSSDYIVVSMDLLAKFFGRKFSFDPSTNILIVGE